MENPRPPARTAPKWSERRRDPEYQRLRARLAGFEALARLLIQRRAELGLTQQQLADRMQTTASVISRIESGQHPTTATTLQRVFDALETRMVVGYEHGPVEAPTREVVVIGASHQGA
jgi:ribosome-binding protein aMBF1 (putative translation factor)